MEQTPVNFSITEMGAIMCPYLVVTFQEHVDGSGGIIITVIQRDLRFIFGFAC